MSSRFSSNSEAKALEVLENHEEMFSQYYMHSNICIAIYVQYMTTVCFTKVCISLSVVMYIHIGRLFYRLKMSIYALIFYGK